MKRILPVAITLLAFGTVLSCDRQDNRWVNAFEALPTPGTPAPAFDAPLLHAGGRVSKDSLLGSPAVIALWSTTCYGSRQSIAALQNLFNTYEPRGVRFLILAADENLDHLTQFVDSARLDIPVAHSPDLSAFDFSDQAPDTDEYRVMFALPSFLVVDAHGTVVARSGGMLADSVLVGALDSLTANARGKHSGTAFTPLARQPQYRWERLTGHAVTGGTPIVFDDRLWLVGVNRNRGFSPGLLVSDDGVTWREQTVPWNPRGAVAVGRMARAST